MIGILNDAIQLRRGDAMPAFCRHRQRRRQHLLHSLLRQRADKEHRHIVKKLQICADFSRILYHRLRVLFDDIPFVHQNDDAFVRLQHMAGNMGILRSDALDAVYE